MFEQINVISILLGLLGGLSLAYLKNLISGSEKSDAQLKGVVEQIAQKQISDNEKCAELVNAMTSRFNKFETNIIQYYALKTELRQHEQENSQRLERVFTEIKEQNTKTNEAFQAINLIIGAINVSQARLEGQITSALGNPQPKL